MITNQINCNEKIHQINSMKCAFFTLAALFIVLNLMALYKHSHKNNFLFFNDKKNPSKAKFSKLNFSLNSNLIQNIKSITAAMKKNSDLFEISQSLIVLNLVLATNYINCFYAKSNAALMIAVVVLNLLNSAKSSLLKQAYISLLLFVFSIIAYTALLYFVKTKLDIMKCCCDQANEPIKQQIEMASLKDFGTNKSNCSLLGTPQEILQENLKFDQRSIQSLGFFTFFVLALQSFAFYNLKIKIDQFKHHVHHS